MWTGCFEWYFDSLDKKLTVGKYKNRTLKEVWEYHSSYIDWVVKNINEFYVTPEVIVEIQNCIVRSDAYWKRLYEIFYGRKLFYDSECWDEIDEKEIERAEQEQSERMFYDWIEEDWERDTYYALGGDDYDAWKRNCGNLDDMMDGMGF